mgnify:CR=1 FL=1
MGKFEGLLHATPIILPCITISAQTVWSTFCRREKSLIIMNAVKNVIELAVLILDGISEIGTKVRIKSRLFDLCKAFV